MGREAGDGGFQNAPLDGAKVGQREYERLAADLHCNFQLADSQFAISQQRRDNDNRQIDQMVR